MCIYARYHLARFYSHKFKSERARELYWALIGDPHSLRCGDEFVNYGLGAIESLAYDFRFAKNYAEAIRLYKLLLRIGGDMGAVSYEARTFENIALCYEKSGGAGARRYFGAFDVEANSDFTPLRRWGSQKFISARANLSSR